MPSRRGQNPYPLHPIPILYTLHLTPYNLIKAIGGHEKGRSGLQSATILSKAINLNSKL
jgi:hypothetical protein